MLVLAADWVTLSSLATAAGTLVLAIATFAAVRSSNRSALIAEAALQEQRRPILVPSRIDDPIQKLNFADGHWAVAAGGYAAADQVNGNVYLAISLRNVGNGIGVCQGWSVRAGQTLVSHRPSHVPEEDFLLQSRDLYIPGGGIGMWQGALRTPNDPLRAAVAKSIDGGEIITVELLYSDLTGRQRAISRFGLLPAGATQAVDATPAAGATPATGATPAAGATPPGGEQRPASGPPPTHEPPPAGRTRYTTMSRLWFLDIDGPRPDSDELGDALARIQRDLLGPDDSPQSLAGPG